MAYVTPTSKTTGDLIDASEWNQNTVDNPIALRTGGIAIASQAANDILYASSSTQLARLAAGTAGQVLSTQGAGSAPSWIDQSQGLRQTFRGLSLRTHPDADVAAYKVFLNHADEIVMHDGTRVADWDDLTADITASGAGGLDTGSEGSSRWYEIHAIRKSSDGTKNLLLHRAKDYLLDETYDSDDITVEIRRSTTTVTALAQTFDTDVTGPCQFVDVKLLKVASPTGQIWAEVYATSGGAPTGAALATSDKLDVSQISTTAQWIRFIFRSPQTLTAGTTYALVLTGNWTASDTNYAGWRVDETSPGYGAGQMYRLESGTWQAKAWDASFKVYVTQNDTAVTMPTGYDQRALIGWVYNDSGSNFRAMSQRDRTALNAAIQIISTSTTSLSTLASLDTIVPPVPVLGVKWQVYNDTSGGTCSFGPSPGTNGSAPHSPFGSYFQADKASSAQEFDSTVPLEFQYLYFAQTGSGSGALYLKGYQW